MHLARDSPKDSGTCFGKYEADHPRALVEGHEAFPKQSRGSEDHKRNVQPALFVHLRVTVALGISCFFSLRQLQWCELRQLLRKQPKGRGGVDGKRTSQEGEIRYRTGYSPINCRFRAAEFCNLEF